MANRKFGRPNKKPEEEIPAGKIPAYGGYSTRHEYEKSREKKGFWKPAAAGAILLLLMGFAVLGIVSLIRGDFLPEEGERDNAGSIKVPTQSELGQIELSADEMLTETEISLLTLEVEKEDGAFCYGTGFLVSDDGYAVCAASLFSGVTPKSITAFTGDGLSSEVTYLGEEPTLGIALIQLENQFVYTSVSVENSSFVERGEKLFAVASYKAKTFYGTVSQGVVASVGPAIKIGEGDFAMSVNMIYLDLVPNPTLYGAAVVDPTGAVVGFCTDAVPPLYDSMASVVPIHVVYTVVNNLLAQQ